MSWGCLAAWAAVAQEGTSQIRGRVTDHAGRRAARRDGDRQATRRPGCTAKPSAATTARSSPAAAAGHLPGRRRSSRASRSSCAATSPLEVGKTADDRRASSRSARVEETVNVTSRVAARRRHVEGNRRQHHQRDARRSCRASTATSSASSACCPASCRRSAPSRSAATRSASTARIRATTTTCSTAATTTTTSSGSAPATQARTPIEAIQEFQVVTGQFDAEFGRTSGAIVNAVIKSGTNQLRGSAFELLPATGTCAARTSSGAEQARQGRHAEAPRGAGRSAVRS